MEGDTAERLISPEDQRRGHISKQWHIGTMRDNTHTQIYTPQETLIYIHGIQIYSNGFFTPFCTCHECPARQFDPLTRASVYINTRISRRARAFVCVLIYVYGFTTCCRGQKGRETATANDLLSLGCELFWFIVGRKCVYRSYLY